MSTYVDNIEALIKMNPITKKKLLDEAISEIRQPVNDDSDDTKYSMMRIVIMQKLEEAQQELLEKQKK